MARSSSKSVVPLVTFGNAYDYASRIWESQRWLARYGFGGHHTLHYRAEGRSHNAAFQLLPSKDRSEYGSTCTSTSIYSQNSILLALRVSYSKRSVREGILRQETRGICK